MKFPPKDHFSYDDLEKRWNCGREEIHRVVLTGQLIPARFTLPSEASVVVMKHEDVDMQWDESAHSKRPVAPLPLRPTEDDEVEHEDDDDLASIPAGRWMKRGFLYLRMPRRTSATRCHFLYASDYPNDRMTLESLHVIHWVKFDEPIDIDDPSVVFLLDQVNDFEVRNHEQLMMRTNERFDAIAGKSKTCYQNIIGALCDLLWAEQHPDQSEIVQAEIIKQLIEKYGAGDFPGFSERNLKTVLSPAIKAIRNN